VCARAYEKPDNKRLQEARKMFQRYMKAETQKYYDMFLENTINLMRSKHRGDEEGVTKFANEEARLLCEIKNSMVSDLFENLLISEFKEQIYEVMRFPYMTMLDTDLACEIEKIILENYGENALYEHTFDPMHFIYNDGKHHYMFYHMVEVNGDSILDEWYDE
jgi:hypothetical protein